MVKNFPKVECPFERELVGGEYVCIPTFKKGYEWIFDKNVCNASEKLDGSNSSVLMRDGVIVGCWNRTERLPFFSKGKAHFIKGFLNSFEKGYVEFLPDGQTFGEMLGPKLQGNPYELHEHLWLPFEKARKDLEYKFWHNAFVPELDLTEPLDNCPKLLAEISELFKVLKSRWFVRRGSKKGEFAEGIIFYNKETGHMCKIRRDMFEWYKGRPHAWNRFGFE